MSVYRINSDTVDDIITATKSRTGDKTLSIDKVPDAIRSVRIPSDAQSQNLIVLKKTITLSGTDTFATIFSEEEILEATHGKNLSDFTNFYFDAWNNIPMEELSTYVVLRSFISSSTFFYTSKYPDTYGIAWCVPFYFGNHLVWILQTQLNSATNRLYGTIIPIGNTIQVYSANYKWKGIYDFRIVLVGE